MRKNHISDDEREMMKKMPGYIQVYYYHEKVFQVELMTEMMYHAMGGTTEATEAYYDESKEELIHPNDREKLYATMEKSLLSHTELYADLRLRKINEHRYQWYRTGISGKSIGDDEALIYLSFVNISDLQARNVIQQEQSENRDSLLETILNTTQTPIFWKDEHRRFVGANRAFLDYYGFLSQDSIVGKTDEDMGWHPDPMQFKDDEESVLQGTSTYLVHGKCRRRGEIREILASKSPIYCNGRVAGLVGSFIDITDNYRQDRKIATLNDQLNEAVERERLSNRAINEFLSRIGHEIKTPMNAIIGFSHLAIEKTDSMDMKDYLHKIAISGEYLLGIINDVVDLRKIEGGEMTLAPKRCSLHEVLSTVNAMVEPLARARNITYTVKEENIKTHYAVCDQRRVEQILINILNNAVRFTDAGGYVELSIRQETFSDRIKVIFTVKDSGCGMSPEFLLRLFQPFSQENRDPSRYGTGTGLGLAISKRFARLMGGDIVAESSEGKGSVFTATIMVGLCNQEEKDAVRSEVNNAGEDNASLYGKRILIAEDNELNVEVITGLLEQIQIQVDTAANGSEAIEMFSQSQTGDYDAILMDLQMPVMDGYEATEQIRSLERDDATQIPIIAMSADIFEESANTALERGMDGYISKPLNNDQLFRTLKKLINREKNQ